MDANVFKAIDLSSYKQKLTIKKTNPKIELAGEIYEFFGKRLKFPVIMGIISRNGVQCVRECFEETKKDKPVVELFMWRIKKYGTKFGKTV